MFGLFFVVCLLLPTLLAAPTITSFQKRSEVTCNNRYGTKINPDDCFAALKTVPVTIWGQDVRYSISGSSAVVQMPAIFSSTNTNPRYKLPQYFGSGSSCTLGVSLANPDDLINFNWDALRRELSIIIDKCIVNGGGIGGSSSTYKYEFDIAVWAEPLNDDDDDDDGSESMESPKGFCGVRSRIRLFDCLNTCFGGGCSRKTSPVSGPETS